MNDHEAAGRWLSRWIYRFRRGTSEEPNRDALVDACRIAGVAPPREGEGLREWAKRAHAPYPEEAMHA